MPAEGDNVTQYTVIQYETVDSSILSKTCSAVSMPSLVHPTSPAGPLSDPHPAPAAERKWNHQSVMTHRSREISDVAKMFPHRFQRFERTTTHPGTGIEPGSTKDPGTLVSKPENRV